MGTARLTDHARQRCVEMGISTKVAKRIAADPSLVLPDFRGHPDRRFLWSRREPDYAVVVEGPPRSPESFVVTVLHWSPDRRLTRGENLSEARHSAEPG